MTFFLLRCEKDLFAITLSIYHEPHNVCTAADATGLYLIGLVKNSFKVLCCNLSTHHIDQLIPYVLSRLEVEGNVKSSRSLKVGAKQNEWFVSRPKLHFYILRSQCEIVVSW